MIGYESGVANVVDPLGGSYYVESLTDELEGAGAATTSTGSTRWAAPWPRSRPGFYQDEIARGGVPRSSGASSPAIG